MATTYSLKSAVLHAELQSKVDFLQAVALPDVKDIVTLHSFSQDVESMVYNTTQLVADVDTMEEKWVNHISSLSPADQADERAEFEARYFAENTGLFRLTYRAREAMDRASAKADIARNFIAELQLPHAHISAEGDAAANRFEQEATCEPPVNDNAPPNFIPFSNQNFFHTPEAKPVNVPNPVKLPTLPLPKFNGNEFEFSEFWSLFKTAVHDRPLDNAAKMSYLKSCLTGEPRLIISNFDALPGESYIDAVDTLKRRYGNTDNLSKNLHRRLLEPFDTSTTSAFRNSFESFEAVCRQLQSLGEAINTKEVETALESKLPKRFLEKTMEKAANDSDWDANKLRKTVDYLLGIQESAEKVDNLNRKMNFAGRQTPQGRKAVQNVSTPQGLDNQCGFCDGKHNSESCRTYFTFEQRSTVARQKRLCFRCLKRHNLRFCQSRDNCNNCNGAGHHTSLCKRESPNLRTGTNFNRQNQTPHRRENQSTPRANQTDPAADRGTNAAAVTVKEPKRVMHTTSVRISNPNNPDKVVSALAFFDCGSSHTFISDSLADRLELQNSGEKTLTVNTFGSDIPMTGTYKVTAFSLHLKNGKTLPMSVLRRKKMINKINTAHVPHDWATKEQVEVKYKVAEPEILIGGDYFDELIPVENTVKINDYCSIIDSPAGAIVRTKVYAEPEKPTTGTVTFATETTNPQLDDPITKLWEFDNAGAKDLPSNELAEVKRIFEETCKREEDGRYTVSWPFADLTGLPKNLGLCINRLNSIWESLVRNGALKDYNEIFLKYQKDEMIKKFNPSTDPGEHYDPHHPVFRFDKETTQIRNVNDASAKTTNGKALNDCIFNGKPEINSLVQILMYVRCKPIVISSDVQSAFLMINLSEDSQKYCCFLWLKDITKPPTPDNIIHLRWLRMPFGVNASPLLLQLVIEKHLDWWASEHPEDQEITEEIKKRIYVDNVIQIADTPEEALLKARKAKEIFADAKMNLRKFESNDPRVDQLLEGRFKDTKLLGIRWTKDDNFVIGWPQKDKGPPKTKRQLLSFTALPFDPAQLISPAVLPLKMSIQEMWKLKQTWNDPLTAQNREKIKELYNERSGQAITIPRKLFNNPDSSLPHELHIFADSSGKAYGVAAYIVQCGDTRQAKLIMAKSRLAPLKPILTIPRLELTALALAGNIVDFIKSTVPFTITRVVAYSDSTTCLHWLNRAPDGDRFVNNRISKLKAADIEFRYVPTKLNPADIASRGCSPQELKNSSIWWNGPPFIEKPESEWPMNPAETDQIEEYTANVAAVIVQESDEPIIDPTNIASWKKLRSVAYYTLKFLSNLEKRTELQYVPKKGADTATLCSAATAVILRQIQNRTPLTEKRVKELDLIKDDKGIWRKNSRLQNSKDVNNTTKNPVYLPYTPETELLIIHLHDRLGHASVNHTLTELRQKFYLPQGRSSVKKAIRRRCMKCRRTNATPFSLPSMPNLPENRVTAVERPFTHVGVDYAGPFHVNFVKDTQKAYICLFTCMVTRAVHLEVVYSANAADFLCALRRFSSKRLPPKSITSDNGGQFKATSAIPEIKSLAGDPEVESFSKDHGIKWKFITERAPWKGGFYERLIGLTKKALKGAIGKRRLSCDTFSTYVSEAELIVNMRPLTEITSDTDKMALRPIDFLIPHGGNTIPGFDFEDFDDPDDPTYTPKRTTGTELSELWRKLNTNVAKFWNCWKKEYLTELRDKENRQHRSKRFNTNRTPRINEVVIVEDENVDKELWSLGRIVNIETSPDGKVRTAQVQTANGKLINRAVCHLYPLEVTSGESQNDNDEPGMAMTMIANEEDDDNSLSSARVPVGKICSDMIKPFNGIWLGKQSGESIVPPLPQT